MVRANRLSAPAAMVGPSTSVQLISSSDVAIMAPSSTLRARFAALWPAVPSTSRPDHGEDRHAEVADVGQRRERHGIAHHRLEPDHSTCPTPHDAVAAPSSTRTAGSARYPAGLGRTRSTRRRPRRTARRSTASAPCAGRPPVRRSRCPAPAPPPRPASPHVERPACHATADPAPAPADAGARCVVDGHRCLPWDGPLSIGHRVPELSNSESPSSSRGTGSGRTSADTAEQALLRRNAKPKDFLLICANGANACDGSRLVQTSADRSDLSAGRRKAGVSRHTTSTGSATLARPPTGPTATTPRGSRPRSTGPTGAPWSPPTGRTAPSATSTTAPARRSATATTWAAGSPPWPTPAPPARSPAATTTPTA